MQSKEPGAYGSSRAQTFIEHLLCYPPRQSREQRPPLRVTRARRLVSLPPQITGAILFTWRKLLQLYEPQFPCLYSEL